MSADELAKAEDYQSASNLIALDILAAKLNHVVALVAVAAIVIAFGGSLILVIVVRLSRGGMSDLTAKRIAAIWVSLALPLLLLAGGSLWLLYASAWQKFNHIMAQKPNRLVISSQGKTNVISDPVVIREFFQIVTRSKKVSAHHSHSVSDVKLLFPQNGYIYSLGRDSEYSNEFWFDWNGISGRSGDVGGSLGHLRSDELADWVQRYSP